MASSNSPTPLRRLLTNPPALLAICIVFDVIIAVTQAKMHTPPKAVTVLQQFAAIIDAQYHECVPLGWFPENGRWPGYFPTFNANVADKEGMFHAQWVGELPSRTRNDPRATSVKAVLDEFTRLGLLVRRPISGGLRYNLTNDGRQYYYETNRLGNNVEGWSYMCFSRLHAKTVAWVPRSSKRGGIDGASGVARIRFSWEQRVEAPWVTPLVKAHAVELNPTSNPAEATVRRYVDGRWRLTKFDFAFPRVENPSTWMTAHSR